MYQDGVTVRSDSDLGHVDGFLGRLRHIWQNGDIPWVRDLPISRRIGLLVGLAAWGALAFSLVNMWAEQQLRQATMAQENFRLLNDMAGDVRAKAALLQNYQEQFLRERTPASVQMFQQELGFIAQTLTAMHDIPQYQAAAGHVDHLQQGMTGVGSHFQQVAELSMRLGLSDSLGLRGQLASSVKAIEDELKMWPNAQGLIPHMLRLRSTEKDFMLYGGEHHLSQLQGYAAQFEFDLDVSALPKSTKEDFRQLLANYGTDMDHFVSTSLQLAEQVAKVRELFQSMQPDLLHLFTYARDGMSQSLLEQESVRHSTSRWVTTFGILTISMFLLSALLLARSIVKPVRAIEQAMLELAAGNHQTLIPGSDRRDEIGAMAQAVKVFKDDAIAIAHLREEQNQLHQKNREKMLALAEHFEQAVKSVADHVTKQSFAIKDIAQGMVATNQQGGEDKSLNVAEAASDSRFTVRAVADAAQQMMHSSSLIAQNVGVASHVVADAVQELDRTNLRVQKLADLASNIDRIVDLIEDIAKRTHMLSLNAAIEAQRAGEAGQGFNIVATEIRYLAHNTAEATKQIDEQLSAIQDAMGETVTAMNGVGTAIRRMDDIARQVAQSVQQQLQVADKIGQCVDDVRNNSDTVSEGVVGVTQSAARYCGTALEVMWAADDLAKPAAELKREVDGFLSTIRSGS